MKRLLSLLLAMVFLTGCGFGVGAGTPSTMGIPANSVSIFPLNSETPTRTHTAGTATPNITPFITPSPTPMPEGRIRIHFLDVGNGDSIFIELGQGRCMLIDAAVASYGGKIISYIQKLGYTELTYLVASHPHADHIGGMQAVVEAFAIGQIYMPRCTSTTQTYENLLLAIQSKGKKIKTAKAGVNILTDGGLQLDIVAPTLDSYKETNDYSAVIRLRYGNKSFLFTGDAEEASEKLITREVAADVLKVGHHGSSTSTSDKFLTRVDPTYAVISCGEGNSYGHPHKEILEKLSKAGITVLRTDIHGDIVFTTDGQKIEYTASKASASQTTPPALTPTATKTPTVTPSATIPTTAVTVYITSTGKKYHRKTCSSIGTGAMEISLQEAIAKYEPCLKCKPPTE